MLSLSGFLANLVSNPGDAGAFFYLFFSFFGQISRRFHRPGIVDFLKNFQEDIMNKLFKIFGIIFLISCFFVGTVWAGETVDEVVFSSTGKSVVLKKNKKRVGRLFPQKFVMAKKDNGDWSLAYGENYPRYFSIKKAVLKNTAEGIKEWIEENKKN